MDFQKSTVDVRHRSQTHVPYLFYHRYVPYDARPQWTRVTGHKTFCFVPYDALPLCTTPRTCVVGHNNDLQMNEWWGMGRKKKEQNKKKKGGQRQAPLSANDRSRNDDKRNNNSNRGAFLFLRTQKDEQRAPDGDRGTYHSTKPASYLFSPFL